MAVWHVGVSCHTSIACLIHCAALLSFYIDFLYRRYVIHRVLNRRNQLKEG